MQRTISFTLNGKPTKVTVDDERKLLWVLREDLGLTGTKFGCGEALCGACTVIVNDEVVRSCATSIAEVADKKVVTVEGLSSDERLHPLQEAFAKHHAFQCGYCTPGVIMSAYALMLKTQRPTREQIIRQLDDNLCRCGSHARVVAAIEDVAGVKGGA